MTVTMSKIFWLDVPNERLEQNVHIFNTQIDCFEGSVNARKVRGFLCLSHIFRFQQMRQFGHKQARVLLGDEYVPVIFLKKHKTSVMSSFI